MKVSIYHVKPKLILSLMCLVLSFKTIAQDFDSEKIIEYANNVPFEVKNSTKKLSDYLVKPYITETEKFASIYYWVAKNIRYNDEMVKNPILYSESKDVVDDVMKSKSGVCQHYAELFAELSRLAGLTVYYIDGYTKDNGKVSNMSHAWNLVKIAGTWYFIDATWANAVIKSKGKKSFPKEYFMIKPEDCIKTHIAFDPMWQMLTFPIKYDEFDASKFEILSGKFNYEDSIANYLKLNMIDQQKATIGRMHNNGIFSQVVKKEFALREKNLKISIANQEVNNYNQGIKYSNKGLVFLNNYIKLKNNNFKDKKYGKNALLAMLDSASVNLRKAETNFEGINIQDTGLKHDIKSNTLSINKSKGIISKEIEFVNQYFK